MSTTPELPAVMPQPARAVGIDVGAETAWLVALDLAPEVPPVVETMLCHPIDLDAIATFCDSAIVAIDAPGGPSVRAHLGDDRIAAKFRVARCGEVALVRAGIAVPFVTPTADSSSVPAWMRTGWAIWDRLQRDGMSPLETYPHGVYWRLAGRPLLHKQLPIGALARLRTIARSVAVPRGLEMWSHDGLDALAAAVVAWHKERGSAVPADCSADESWPIHDGSAIWLPPVTSSIEPPAAQ